MLELTFDEVSPTCIAGMSNADYHARPELSASQIKTILKNPFEYINGSHKEPTKAMDFGSCVHKLVLEPLDFEKEFAVSPKYNLRTNEGKASYQSFIDANMGKTIIDEDTFMEAKMCADNVMRIAGNFFKNGVAENSYFSEIGGVGARCRPDYYIEDIGLVVDLKTTQDASPDGFIKSVANFGYYIQEPFYVDVLDSLNKPVNRFIFVAVETKPPYMVGIYELDYISRDHGRSEYMRAIEIYNRIDDFKAPVYKDTEDGEIIQTLTLPNYVFYKKGASL